MKEMKMRTLDQEVQNRTSKLLSFSDRINSLYSKLKKSEIDEEVYQMVLKEMGTSQKSMGLYKEIEEKAEDASKEKKNII